MRVLRAFFSRPLAGAASIILVALAFLALTADIIAPLRDAPQDLGNRLLPPGSTGDNGRFFLAGTDQLGRDMLTLLIHGTRVSLIVAVAAVVLGGGLGLLVGVISGYRAGWLDALLQRILDVQLAFPFLLLAMVIAAILGPGLINVIVVLALTSWVSYAKVVRATSLGLMGRDFVEASRAVGGRSSTIIARDIIPNVMSPFLVLASYEAAAMVIAEASLSYLGLGVPADLPTWGSMLSDGRDYVITAWWIAALPGVALVITALSFNLLGDGLRDALDPTQKKGRR
ncbi:ABC transporter permease [Georgenia faecalis]|uniref:ABC transporter permease n=1 Tax=Georgenia faecalis TaxID=2483799 RepID=A0ABV9D9E4_9MICO|nr:ABC transporter permease [Georgenia faecalis]